MVVVFQVSVMALRYDTRNFKDRAFNKIMSSTMVAFITVVTMGLISNLVSV